MAEIGAFEAKTKLASLIRRVERGEQITITRRGKAFRKNATLGGISWKELRDAGWKY